MAVARSRAKTRQRLTVLRLMRYLAKNVVAADLADKCTIQLSYAIGVSKPISVYVDLHEIGKVDATKLEGVLGEVMDLSPRGIRTHLGLNKPIFARTATYGHLVANLRMMAVFLGKTDLLSY